MGPGQSLHSQFGIEPRRLSAPGFEVGVSSMGEPGNHPDRAGGTPQSSQQLLIAPLVREGILGGQTDFYILSQPSRSDLGVQSKSWSPKAVPAAGGPLASQECFPLWLSNRVLICTEGRPEGMGKK